MRLDFKGGFQKGEKNGFLEQAYPSNNDLNASFLLEIMIQNKREFLTHWNTRDWRNFKIIFFS